MIRLWRASNDLLRELDIPGMPAAEPEEPRTPYRVRNADGSFVIDLLPGEEVLFVGFDVRPLGFWGRLLRRLTG